MTEIAWPFLPLMGMGLLATIDEDGSPHQGPAHVFYDGECYYVRMLEESRELANLRRDPRFSLNTHDPNEGGKRIVIRGHVMEARLERSTGLMYVRVGVESVDD